MSDKDTVPQTDEEKSRREFLEKAGKLALYTPPVLMMMMQPSRAGIASGGHRRGNHNRGRGLGFGDGRGSNDHGRGRGPNKN